MGLFLGIDTSNYTTSCALYDTDTGEISQKKRLLPVPEGGRGLRQSEAVFHHTKRLSGLLEELTEGCSISELSGVGVSFAPRLEEGSYMPCFLVGEGVARSISAVTGAPLYRTSHQVGHILAALYSADRLELLDRDEPFMAFHVSGGTTDLLMCSPDKDRLLDVREIGGTSDLKAGQCIDRIGVRLGLGFPCGAELERLAAGSSRIFKIRPSVKELRCSLSGIENKCLSFLDDGGSAEDTARLCMTYVKESLRAVVRNALERYGEMPLVFAGGVMSNSDIRDDFSREFGAYFASPQFSSDNAAGVAVYAAKMADRGGK